MDKKTRKGFNVQDLNSLAGIMIAGGETEFEDSNRIKEIKRWHQRGHRLFTEQQTIQKREKITLDAKEISIGSERIWVWAAMDLREEMVLAIHVSYVKNMATTCSFLKKISKLCKGTLPRVYVNGDTWSPGAFEKLGFGYAPVELGPGSVAETFLTIVNCRICRFLERFADKRSPRSITWWIEGFAGFTNYWTAKRGPDEVM